MNKSNVGSKRYWLTKFRKKAGLTHQEVAVQAEISRSFYSEIEQGEKNPSVETAKKIARVLKFPWTYFFEEKGRKTSSSKVKALA